MTYLPTPQEAIDMDVKNLGVDRESAITMASRVFEASLRVNDHTSEGEIRRKLAEMMLPESRVRAPWIVDYAMASYRKQLPGWVRALDEATERGQDPATVLSISEKCTMARAAEMVELARASKEGKTIEEIVEIAHQMDNRKTDAQMYEEIRQNIFLS